MNKVKAFFLKRRLGIYLSIAIVFALFGIRLGIWFNERYTGFQSPVVIRSPFVPRVLVSPLSTKKTSLVPVAEAKTAPISVEAQTPVEAVPTPMQGSDLKSLVLSYFPADQRSAVDQLVFRESTWNQYAVNSSSGACGLFQSLPCAYSLDNVKEQASWGEAYIRNRYQNANNAWAFWQAHHWY